MGGGETDPFRIDPTDSHAMTGLLDPEHYRPEDVDLDALFEVRLSYLAVEEYAQASDVIVRITWFAPEDSRESMEAWASRGVAHAQIGEHDEAIGAAFEALRIDGEGRKEGESRFPNLAAVAERNLAYALWESGDSSHPLEHAERAAELDTRLPEAWFDLGCYYNERALWEPARGALERALSLGLRQADVHEELARTLDNPDEPVEAEWVAAEAEALCKHERATAVDPSETDEADPERFGA